MKKLQDSNPSQKTVPSAAIKPSTDEFKAFVAPRNIKIASILSLVAGSVMVCILILIGGTTFFTTLKLHAISLFYTYYLLIIILLFVGGRLLDKFYPCIFSLLQGYNYTFNIALLLPAATYTFWERLFSSLHSDDNALVLIVLLALSSTMVLSKMLIWIRSLSTMAVFITFELLAKTTTIVTLRNIVMVSATAALSIVISYILLRFTYGEFRLTQELMSLNETLENLSRTDGLTSLPDRRVFQETLAAEWARASRHHYPITLFVIDIDFFKQYNDNYGHLEGDNVIRAVALALKENIQRSGNLIARYGGDEFTAVLPHTTETEANVFSEILRNKIFELHIAHDYSLLESKTVTVSIGAATMIPAFGKHSDDLFALADSQLYKAKELGRNRVSVIAE